MLLDRKKIRRWAKWIALGLAIAFAIGFLLFGIGGSGVSVSEIFNSGCSSDSTDTTDVVNDQVQQWLDALAADPTDTIAMLGLADYYEGLFDASQGSSTESAASAAQYYEDALAADPTLKEVYIDLGKLYLKRGLYTDAARILNQATAVDPDNPDVYLYLGTAQKEAGNTGEAILAWEKYLELDPDSRQAAAISTELETLTAPSTTSTLAPTTTTAE